MNFKNFFKLSILSVFAIALSSCKTKTTKEAAKKPNVIIVITDDQGYGDIALNGNKIIKTPTIDNFATEAVNLTNYHVGTTCAPTRAGLLTGRNCNRNGVWHTIMGASMLNKGEVTMAQVLKDKGYNTAMIGKWHLGDNHPFLPEDNGFELSFHHGGGGVGQTPDYWKNDYFDDTYIRNGVPEKKEGYCTDVWFDEAMSFIEEKKDDPFFCYLSLNAPHGPYNVPEEYYNIYKDENSLIEAQKRFYGMITNVDDNFKRLLKKVDDLGIADNTIVIFTTDNGTAKGYKKDPKTGEYHGYNAGMKGTKASEYEGGHRVPFIIKWPNGGLTGGKFLDKLVAHVDMLPTLVSLLGEEYTSDKIMDGTDVSDYLLGKGDAPKRYLVTDTQRVSWPIKGKNSCVMDDEWRLIKGNELYNITEDPGQENNIADQYPEKVAEMNAFYDQWWSEVIKETKYSTIELGKDDEELLTCHDARTVDFYPPWNQQLVRAGKVMKPASFSVNFVEAGKYKFFLRRWPKESGLAIGAAPKDGVPANLYTEGCIDGVAMNFSKAFLKIGDNVTDVAVNNEETAAILEMDVPAGKTNLLAYFTMENGVESNAFYIDIEKVK